jgi:hypothetical protein
MAWPGKPLSRRGAVRQLKLKGEEEGEGEMSD